MSLLHDAYTAWLSGLTHKTGNEVHWVDEYGDPITIELVNADKKQYIVRRYYENGNKYREEEYQNSQRHGKSIAWHENGNKYCEHEYQNGQRHGKSTWWYENGNKHWEEECQNDQRHGKLTGWYESGNKEWEHEYQHGQLIRKIL